MKRDSVFDSLKRRWISRRGLWAMDLFHWSFKMCPAWFEREFLDYVVEIGKSYQRAAKRK